jgi:hypothetical protein
MFSAIRKRMHLTPSTVIATLALVFAMTGGAYAAKHYLITSTKQISPKVLKALKGKAGANGAQGLTGATGPAGPAGTAGAAGAKGETGAAGGQGAEGKEGKAGTNGKNGFNGKEGEKGVEGSPWTAGGKLPSEKTETGAWNVIGLVTLPNNGTLLEEEQEARTASVSFTLPVESAVTAVFVDMENGPSECPGTEEKPEAKPGFLCIYYDPRDGHLDKPSLTFIPTSSTGGVIFFKVSNEAGTNTLTWGSWAVTAK